MIDVHLTDQCVDILLLELRRASSNEIGGVLGAEHVGDCQFRISDLSIQRTGGSRARFIRGPSFHRRFISRFLSRKNQQYERFNYLGEWHSHPSFSTQPSLEDIRQMQRLIEDRAQQANFLVLMIVRLDELGNLEGSAHVFLRGQAPVRARLHIGVESRF
jgi:integrative and conjugative element protein (TIGR02256 family)